MIAARLVHRALVADRTMAFWFEPEAPLSFTPGQAIDIVLPTPAFRDDLGNARTFSIASLPGEARLMVATRLSGSAMKRSLAEGPIGQAVEIDGPFGSFTLHRNQARPAVFLAGGIGITPFHSVIGDVVRRHERRSMTLVYSNRKADDAAWMRDFECWSAEDPEFRLVATLSQPAAGQEWRHETGRVDTAFLQAHAAAPADTIFYVAGPPNFVAAMQRLLPDVGADPDNIRAEDFAGY